MYKFNRYSWFLFILFLITSFTMGFKPNAEPMRGIFICTPLIAMFVLWSEIRYKPEKNINSHDNFLWDFFIITYSFVIGGLLSLCFQFRIIETITLWPLYLYFMTTIGMIFSIVFSLGALLLPPHTNYTKTVCGIISLGIFFFNIFINIYPNYISVQLLFISLGVLLFAHLIKCFFIKAGKV